MINRCAKGAPMSSLLRPFHNEKFPSTMKKAKILHNPGAGEGETSGPEIVHAIKSAGFKCSYSSTKGVRWENILTKDIDFVVLAGGDGTVRKIAAEILDRKLLDKKLPIGLLPMGTANNIAKTLGLSGDAHEVTRTWKSGCVKKFDVGRIKGLAKPDFFLEGFGYGLFPKLMQQMKKTKRDHIEDPAEKLDAALRLLRKLILAAPAKNCKLQIDETDYSGKFLLIEAMNIRSIGPNLQLAPDADPGDGQLDVVFITENQREQLAAYVEAKIQGKEVLFDFPILRARDLNMFWEGRHLHVDDEYHKLDKPVKIKISLRERALDFLVPCRPDA
jgi:diacylglycerol kinase family enzyme